MRENSCSWEKREFKFFENEKRERRKNLGKPDHGEFSSLVDLRNVSNWTLILHPSDKRWKLANWIMQSISSIICNLIKLTQISFPTLKLIMWFSLVFGKMCVCVPTLTKYFFWERTFIFFFLQTRHACFQGKQQQKQRSTSNMYDGSFDFLPSLTFKVLFFLRKKKEKKTLRDEKEKFYFSHDTRCCTRGVKIGHLLTQYADTHWRHHMIYLKLCNQNEMKRILVGDGGHLVEYARLSTKIEGIIRDFCNN